MRKVYAGLFSSIDGVVERPNEWQPAFDEEMGAALSRMLDGQDAVLLGRVTPVVRSFVSIPAGIFEMPLAPYTLFTLIGSALWAFAFAAIGYAVGSNYERFHHFFDIALVAGAALLVLYLVVRRVSRLKRAS